MNNNYYLLVITHKMQHKKTSKTCNKLMNETFDNHKTGKLVGNAASFRLSYGTTM